MKFNKKLVLFGAGKIGRSFIGQLFSRAGYEVVFVDIYKPVIDELNKRGNYNVIIKGEKEEIINVKNVRGILANEKEKVIYEIAEADIAAVSVGQQGLPHIISLIAEGLKKRYALSKNLLLDIIIAENLRNAQEYFGQNLKQYLDKNYPFDELVGLVETSIGKMVPIMSHNDMEKDILQVFAEPYNTLILDKKGFKNPIPEVEGLAPKENMKAWVDRKSFIHNLGHAVTAYVGYLHNNKYIYTYEVLANKEIYEIVRETMLQSADILLKNYPDEFTKESLTEHIDDLIYRFQNKALGDTVFRVGMDLLRKLGPEDRLCGAIRMGMKHNMPVDKILYALVCGFYFRAKDENGNMLARDVEFISHFNKGIKHVLISVCGFDEKKDKEIIENAEKINNNIRTH